MLFRIIDSLLDNVSLGDLHEAAPISGIPFTAVRRLIAESQLPATRAGRGGKFMIARTAIVKYSERIK